MKPETGLRIPERPEIPLFPNTEAAIEFGRGLRRVLARDEFQTLVRTWMVAQLAFDNASNDQARANLAFRVQTLREAVRGFLFDDPATPALARSPLPALAPAGAEKIDHELATASSSGGEHEVANAS